MKKILAILVMVAVMSSPAWAGQNYSLVIGDNGAAFCYNSRNAPLNDDAYGVGRHRHGRQGDRRDKRVETVDNRLAKQWNRIRDGREHGDLTRREGLRLQREHRQIKSYLDVTIGDRRLSAREWRNLSIMLDQADDNIYRLRHNHRYAKNDVPVRSPENRWKFNRKIFR